MGTLCNLNLVIFKCFYYQSEKIVAGDINSLNLLVVELFPCFCRLLLTFANSLDPVQD